jgi:hypothetical protein
MQHGMPPLPIGEVGRQQACLQLLFPCRLIIELFRITDQRAFYWGSCPFDNYTHSYVCQQWEDEPVSWRNSVCPYTEQYTLSMGGENELENGQRRTEVKDWDGPDDPVLPLQYSC